jgi:predicted AlkP superfamily phosphohydrolase/phosphomutase
VEKPDPPRQAKVFVIGLDGATWDNLLPLVEKGDMPHLGSLLDSGSHGVLRSTQPCVTPPAWGSFLTGAGPAKHGVLDFTKRIDSDLFEFVTSRDLAVPKLWHALSHFGRRSVFLGLPFTHPPDAGCGVIVPGPPVPISGIETEPPDLGRRLLEKIPDYTAELRQGNKAGILSEIYGATKNRYEAARWLMKSEKWDFFMVTFIATDRLHHHFWHDKKTVSDYYRHLDGVLGRISRELDEEDYLLLMSDHGFTAMKTRFYPNQWLAGRGYLKARFIRPGKEWDRRYLNPTARRKTSRGKVYGWRRLLRLLPGCGGFRWVIDLKESRAFSSFGHLTGIFVNVKGRYEQGIVEEGAAYEAIRDELIADLSALGDPESGAPLFGTVERREKLFDGHAVERMPDVVCEVADPACRLRSNLGLSRGRVFSPFRRKKSYHAPDGIFYARGPGIKKGKHISGAKIEDVAPLILRLMGHPRLSTMEGGIPEEALEGDLIRRGELPPFPAEAVDFTSASHTFSDEDRTAITRGMETLGYL